MVLSISVGEMHLFVHLLVVGLHLPRPILVNVQDELLAARVRVRSDLPEVELAREEAGQVLERAEALRVALVKVVRQPLRVVPEDRAVVEDVGVILRVKRV